MSILTRLAAGALAVMRRVRPVVCRVGVAAVLSLALTTGCTPSDTHAKTSSSNETASLDGMSRSPLPPAPLSLPTNAAGTVEPIDADPAVYPAWVASHAAKRSEAELYDHYANELRPKLDRAKAGRDWESPTAAMPSFITAVRTLRAMGEDVLRADDKFRVLAERHRRDLTRTPPSYRAAGARWKQMSADEEYPVLRGEYEKYAANAETFAAVYEERARAFAKFEADVAAATRFTRKSVECLREAEVSFGLAPTLDEGDLRRRYREQLAVYVKAFGDYLTLHEEWTATVRARPLPEKPADPPSSPKPGREYPSGPSQLVSVSTAASDHDAIQAAASVGHHYAVLRTNLKSKTGFLTDQVQQHAGRPLPPDVKATLDWYKEGAKYVNSAERLAIRGQGPWWVTSPSQLETVPKGHAAVGRLYRNFRFPLGGRARRAIRWMPLSLTIAALVSANRS